MKNLLIVVVIALGSLLNVYMPADGKYLLGYAVASVVMSIIYFSDFD